MKKIALMLSMVLACVFFFPALPAYSSGSPSVEERMAALESKYNIHIKYEKNENGDLSLTAANLYTLDKALQRATAPVVKQVSSFYEKKLGSKLTYFYRFKTSDQVLDANLEILGMFNRETAVIEMFIPVSSRGTYISGDSPITILHEFAHAYYFMFTEYYGKEKMEKEWVALNEGTKYNEGFLAYAYNQVTFMSSYGATSLVEDFAELFSHALLRCNAGQGMAHRLLNGERKTPLGKKLDFIEKMMPMYLSDTKEVVGNIQRAFNTPYNLYFQDLKLNGEKLQYIGFASPKYVLNGILSHYGLTRESSIWIYEIGGWQALATDGSYYLVFPGGYCEKLKQPLDVKAA